MTLLWIGYATMVASLVAVSVAVLERAAHLAQLPSRFLWLGGLVAGVAFPLLWFAGGDATADATALSPLTLPAVVVTAGARAEALAAERLRIGADVGRAGLLLWTIWSLIALARIGRSMQRLMRERAGWTAASLDGIPVLITPSLGPAAVGIMWREIVIPRWLLDLPERDRVLVLAHERSHLAARDPALRVAAAVITALMPWNPAIRWMEQRLVLAMERDCDARVLATPVDRHVYARLLVDIAARGSTPPLLAALSERTTHLEWRITAMRTRHRAMPVHAAALAAVGTIITAAAIALPGPGRQAAAQERPEAAFTATTADTTYREFEVDTAVGPRSMTPPVYPAEQRAALVNGEVIMQFVVDSSGALDMATLKVLRSNHEAFTAAVRAALATASFKPAWKSGKPVRQVVQMPFVFRVSNP